MCSRPTWNSETNRFVPPRNQHLRIYVLGRRLHYGVYHSVKRPPGRFAVPESKLRCARYVLIGELALASHPRIASHNVIRATPDVDLLTDLEKADEIEAELIKRKGVGGAH